ncbi:unnamed protein product [marine sediment metagenome]|uniref:Uncharacterized protein n=1 Tax=marine sediment metagenome TaxID=412755 RepID=X1LFM9_9ZZZZ
MVDKEYYSKNSKIEELYFFIYDPKFLLINRKDFVEDLEKNKPEQLTTLQISRKYQALFKERRVNKF